VIPPPHPVGRNRVHANMIFTENFLHTLPPSFLSVDVVVVVRNALLNDFFSSHSRPKTRVLTGLDGSDAAKPFL